MSSEIVVGMLSLLGTLCSTFAGIITSTKLTNYRISELEKKVEKHNSVIERTAILERDEKSIWKSIDEIKNTVKDVEREVIHDSRQ